MLSHLMAFGNFVVCIFSAVYAAVSQLFQNQRSSWRGIITRSL
jgi:hypothetical protein